MGKKKKQPKKLIIKTFNVLARELGCNPGTLEQWRVLGCPANKDPVTGEYNLEPCIEWRNKNRRSRGRPPLDPADRINGASRLQPEKAELVIAKLEAEIAKLREDARGRSLKNDEYEGLLLPADDVRQWIASRFLRIKSRLEQLPDELQLLASANLRPQLRADLSNAIHDLLLEMSSWEVQSQKTDMTE